MDQDLIQIAQVLKSNGTDGQLIMSFRDIAPEDINLKEPVFIVFDGLPVPFFIESFQRRGTSKALVHLTDILTGEDAEELAGKAVYMSPDSLPEDMMEDEGFAVLIGWTLLVPDGEISEGEDFDVLEIGEVVDFMDIPNNPCIEVETKNGAVIIPLHEDLILSLDPDNQEILMQVPEGLL